jgi:uncharacterized coiled-coil DUF342 family protein
MDAITWKKMQTIQIRKLRKQLQDACVFADEGWDLADSYNETIEELDKEINQQQTEIQQLKDTVHSLDATLALYYEVNYDK